MEDPLLCVSKVLYTKASGKGRGKNNSIGFSLASVNSNNHDPYDLNVLTCKPVEIGDYAWIGAGATVLPGVRVGCHAVIGASSVVTKDVPDYAVAVGNPARVIRMLDKDKFKEH